MLLDEEVVTVHPDGTSTSHERRVIKILRPQGRDEAMVMVPSDSDEKLNYLHAWSISPAGRQYTVKDNEFSEVTAPDAGILYESVKYKTLRPPAADPGAVIACEFERRQRPYISEDDWDFQESIPVYRTAFELDLPPGWEYYSAWVRHAPVTPQEPAPDHYRWELQDVNGIDTEDVPYAPSVSSLAGRMTAHYVRSDLPSATERWAAVGEWYANLASGRAAQTPEIAAQAKELTTGESDFTRILQSITQYMQADVRYVGIEMGIGGWQPHAAAEVFHNRYGDCKDKATLLKAMLASVGINATWVMVDTDRGFVDPALPSISGNHMITAIEIPAGYKNPVLQALVNHGTNRQYLIFDPTDQYTPVGEIRPQLQGSYGLLVDGNQSEIIHLPDLPPGTNLLARTAQFELSPEGTLKGTVTETRAGSEASRLRPLYAGSNPKDQREAMERRLRKDFSGFTLDSAGAENATEIDKNLILHYAITAPAYARLMGNLMLVRARVLGS